jgi:hypothetical protein
MKENHPIENIYVALLGENVDVWRPVKAQSMGRRRYRILEQPYDADIEKWEFEPGETVICENIDSDEGPILAAKRRAIDET